MANPIISVQNLSKSYLVGHRANRDGSRSYMALREVIGRELRNAARKLVDVARGRQVVQGDAVEEFWALKDVSFEVEQGDVLGIIGHNGAGKSTLLKVLSRITEPTGGRVMLSGRVASLLEVGTGFHPELTGRENIYLNGAILGMSRSEIRKKFDEIVAFAEVERFLDTPVKRYSSGMYVRLAFAVAAHLEPEILVVDEVLAVGDAEFQRKCLGKIDEVSRHEGRTVLVVSHNMGVITGLCGKALWLDRGTLYDQGDPHRLVGRYLARSDAGQDRIVRFYDHDRPAWLPDNRLRCRSLEWLSPLPLRNGEPARVRLHFETRAPVAGVSVVFGFDNAGGTRVLSYHLPDGPYERRDFAAAVRSSIELTMDPLILGPDRYTVSVTFRSGNVHVVDFLGECTQVDVVAGPNTLAEVAQAMTHASSGVRLAGSWSWERDPVPSDAAEAPA